MDDKTKLLLLHACDDLFEKMREESHLKHVLQMLDQVKLEEEQIYWHGRDPFTTFNALTKAHEKVYHRVYLAQLDGQAIALRDLLKKHGYVDGAGQSDPIDAVLYRTLDVLQNRLTYAQVREKVINIIKNAYADQQYNAYSTAYMCAACRQALSTFRSTAFDIDARVNDLCSDIERALDGRGIVGLVSNVIEELESKVTEGAKARETETPGDKITETEPLDMLKKCHVVLDVMWRKSYAYQVQSVIDLAKQEMESDHTKEECIQNLLKHVINNKHGDLSTDTCVKECYKALYDKGYAHASDRSQSPVDACLRRISNFFGNVQHAGHCSLREQTLAIINESDYTSTEKDHSCTYVVSELRKLQAKVVLNDDQCNALRVCATKLLSNR